MKHLLTDMSNRVEHQKLNQVAAQVSKLNQVAAELPPDRGFGVQLGLR